MQSSLKKGYTPITIDNLVTGWKDAVKFGPFELVDILNEKESDRVYKKYKSFATMHFAALSEVGESVKNPGLYWRNNVQGSLNLIETSIKNNCSNFIFLLPALLTVSRIMFNLMKKLSSYHQTLMACQKEQ